MTQREFIAWLHRTECAYPEFVEHVPVDRLALPHGDPVRAAAEHACRVH